MFLVGLFVLIVALLPLVVAVVALFSAVRAVWSLTVEYLSRPPAPSPVGPRSASGSVVAPVANN